MRQSITTSRGFDHIIPPRCRSGRYTEVRFTITCEIPSVPTETIDRVAEVLASDEDEPKVQPVFHHPELGFLEATDMTPKTLPAYLARPAEARAIPEEQIPGQAIENLDRARLEIQAKALAYVISEQTVYRRVPEPCYEIDREARFHGTTVQLRVTGAPAFTEDAFGTNRYRRGNGALHEHGHFFGAGELPGARKMVAAVIRAARRHRRQIYYWKPTEEIKVLRPDVFSFDSGRWHQEREQAQLRAKIDDLLEDINNVFTRDEELSPLYPERIVLAKSMTEALQDAIKKIGTGNITVP
jgi:hypothetical protein